ncbi:MAG TPA: hypothetical protein VF208_02220 [Candidatus Binatia bacterium]
MYRGKIILAALLTSASVLGAYLLLPSRSTESNRPLATVDGYLRANYARDFGRAYEYLSSADRQVRTRQNFVNSQGAYSSFTLEVARRLAGFMKVWLIEQKEISGRLIVKVGYRVPAPAELNDLLLNWDEDRLNALSMDKQKELLAELDARNKSGKILNIEGQESVELIKEAEAWKVILDWADGTRIMLQSKLSGGDKLDIRFATTEVMVKNDELFLVNVKIRNPNLHAVTFTVGHLLEPPKVADDLQLVECGLLTPTTLETKQEKEFAMAYQLNTAAGQTHREVKLTYDFKLK